MLQWGMSTLSVQAYVSQETLFALPLVIENITKILKTVLATQTVLEDAPVKAIYATQQRLQLLYHQLPLQVRLQRLPQLSLGLWNLTTKTENCPTDLFAKIQAWNPDWKTSGPVEKKTVLVLNTYGGWKLPLLVDANGRNDGNIFMVFDEGTEVYRSCALTWRNEFFVFGGNSQTRQISKLSGCRLSLVGTLAFDHYLATCSNVGGQAIYLCFNANNADDYKKCRSATNPLGNFTEVTLSTFEHRFTRIASSPSEFYVKVLV